MVLISSSNFFSSGSEVDLFCKLELSAPKKLRPLGQVSNFVVDELPDLLAQYPWGRWDRERLQRRVDDLWQNPPIQAEIDNLPIACLDLMLLQHACDHASVTTPEQLRTISEEICRSLGRINTFLYEDCILSNPLTQDPRVFTNGDVGTAERDFLLVHTLIEQCLDGINARTQDILRRVGEEDSNNALSQAVLEHHPSISAGLKRLRALFLSMRHLRREDFQAFRGYYMSSPRTGCFGPSGKFSAKFFLLRVLVEGGAIRAQIPIFYHEVLDVFHYFPRGDKEILLSYVFPEYFEGSPLSEEFRVLLASFGGQSRSRFSCLREISLESWAYSTGLPDLVASIRNVLDACTSIHLGLVKKNIVD